MSPTFNMPLISPQKKKKISRQSLEWQMTNFIVTVVHEFELPSAVLRHTVSVAYAVNQYWYLNSPRRKNLCAGFREAGGHLRASAPGLTNVIYNS